MMPLIKQFEHLKIHLEAIKLATNDFAEDKCIGRGGFGKVYRGELDHSEGHTVVAIKRLDRLFGQGNPEFWKEVVTLSQYKHENIVSLLGFCDESGEKIIIYEYASKGSLDMYLNNNDLSWTQRLKICIGAARGLAYLHNPGETQQRVLHRDIKSSNILLEENWNARISDLGLSKFGPANQKYTFLVSNAVGTVGYCDPLYAEMGYLTKESDVYSFGVVLFETLCGRLSIVSNNKNDKLQPLTGLVRQYYEENKISELIYANIRGEINLKSLKTFTTIAYRCINMNREERPLMTEVVSKLENALEYQEQQQWESQASSSSTYPNKQLKVLEESVPVKHQPFLQEDVLMSIYEDVFPFTVEQFFKLLLSDGSEFAYDCHSAQMNKILQIDSWHSTSEYDGQIRNIIFRTSNSILYGATKITERQHTLLSTDKRSLVFESVKLSEDVPFGSCFEAHCRWEVETKSKSSCTIMVKSGLHFKKPIMIEQMIRSNAIRKFKEELKIMLEVARRSILDKNDNLPPLVIP